MKNIIILPLLFGMLSTWAQTPVSKSITVQQGQAITMHFDYPELIRVSTWDKNEISIQGTVSINGGESDDAFSLTSSITGNIITVKNEIKNMKSIPQRITVNDGATKIVFTGKEELKKYEQEHGKKFKSVSYGVDMDIILEIKVPQNVETRVESVYGIVEVKDFTAPLIVEATYGAVDAAVRENATGQLKAETNYGEIYTNLNAKFENENKPDENFHTYVSAHPSNGPDYFFGSKYGNVYLRKNN